MVRWVLGIAVAAMLCSGQACYGYSSPGSLSGEPVATFGKAGQTMTLRVRLGDGFQNNTVSVLVDGKQVYQRAGVSTDWTISRADSVDIKLDAPSVQLEVSVLGGPTSRRDIAPGQTPFVEVILINGELQLTPMSEEPPML